MKTAEQVRKEIKENADALVLINKDIDAKIEVKRNKSRIKALKKENQLLKQCELYLKTSPREEYLRGELQSIKERISSIGSHFGTWCDFNRGKFKNLNSAYETAMGIPKLQMQVKTLKYLLN